MKLQPVKSSYGSRPWFAVPVDAERHPSCAVWLFSGQTTIQTLDGPIETDGAVRFFARKRELVAAIERTNGVELA